MRILVTGDRFWACHKLAVGIIRRHVQPYGPDIVIVHGGATGVDESFATAAKGLGVAADAHPGNWRGVGAAREESEADQKREMVRAGAGLCLAVHRFTFNSKGTKDYARLAVEADDVPPVVGSGGGPAGIRG
jgi:YspA, cpYpsA-related SLOG family